MRLFIAVAAALAVSGCSTIINKDSLTRVNSSLTVHEFNDLSNEYAPQPTFVSKAERYGGDPVLVVKADLYGLDKYFYFPSETVPKYLLLIDKYFEWEEKAQSRGDAFEKEIGKAPGYGNFKLEMTFFSARPGKHYLSIKQCVLACTDGDYFYLTRQNASELRRLLVALHEGAIDSVDYDSIYK